MRECAGNGQQALRVRRRGCVSSRALARCAGRGPRRRRRQMAGIPRGTVDAVPPRLGAGPGLVKASHGAGSGGFHRRRRRTLRRLLPSAMCPTRSARSRTAVLPRIRAGPAGRDRGATDYRPFAVSAVPASSLALPHAPARLCADPRGATTAVGLCRLVGPRPGLPYPGMAPPPCGAIRPHPAKRQFSTPGNPSLPRTPDMKTTQFPLRCRTGLRRRRGGDVCVRAACSRADLRQSA